MKRISLLLVATLALTSCGSQKLETNDGKIVSCDAIKRKEVNVKGTSLMCLDGNSSVKLESITGPTLINLWGSWCAPCRQELPLLKKAYRSGKVDIVGINIEEKTIETGRKFAIKAGITWPNLIDPDGQTKSVFGPGVPVTWFLNKDGVITHQHIGIFKSEKELNEEIAKYLG